MIPIAKPLLDENEQKAVSEVLSSGMIASGPKTKEFEEIFANYIGVEHALATTSGTTALHTALLSLGIGKDDEVIIPSFSFIASVNTILFCGAKPVFCDVNRDTFNIDVHKIEDLITEKTKAIMPVHLYGLPANMKKIEQIAEENDLSVIGDACQSHGAQYNNQMVGSLGDVECFSFYPTKNMTTGEGGMITTDDDALAEKVEGIRNHGRMKTDWGYEHNQIGYNYRMTDIAAAIGVEQLQKLPEFIKKRQRNAACYDKHLESVETPFVPKNAVHAYHQYTIKTNYREQLLNVLKRNDVGFGIYYPKPLHQYPHLEQFAHNDLKVSERLCEEVVSLPVHPALSNQDLKKVVDTINTMEA